MEARDQPAKCLCSNRIPGWEARRGAFRDYVTRNVIQGRMSLDAPTRDLAVSAALPRSDATFLPRPPAIEDPALSETRAVHDFASDEAWGAAAAGRPFVGRRQDAAGAAAIRAQSRRLPRPASALDRSPTSPSVMNAVARSLGTMRARLARQWIGGGSERGHPRATSADSCGRERRCGVGRCSASASGISRELAAPMPGRRRAEGLASADPRVARIAQTGGGASLPDGTDEPLWPKLGKLWSARPRSSRPTRRCQDLTVLAGLTAPRGRWRHGLAVDAVIAPQARTRRGAGIADGVRGKRKPSGRLEALWQTTRRTDRARKRAIAALAGRRADSP